MKAASKMRAGASQLNNMAEKILAAFNNPNEALALADELRREGFPRSAISLMSSEPINIEASDSGDEPKTRIGLFAIAGGLLGAGGTLLLTVVTSREMNLVTGGMPIISMWAFGIIVFEMTALGAILAAVGRMFFEARLGRRGTIAGYDEACDEEIANGKIVMAIECADGARRDLAKTLLASNIKPE